MSLHEQLQKARKEIANVPGNWMWRVRSWNANNTYMVEYGEWVFVTDEEIEATRNPDEEGMRAVYTKSKTWWK